MWVILKFNKKLIFIKRDFLAIWGMMLNFTYLNLN